MILTNVQAQSVSTSSLLPSMSKNIIFFPLFSQQLPFQGISDRQKPKLMNNLSKYYINFFLLLSSKA